MLNHSWYLIVKSFPLQRVFLLRGYHIQGDNFLKSVERFDHMMFVCIFQAALSLLVGNC
jgi:hypothetical protein